MAGGAWCATRRRPRRRGDFMVRALIVVAVLAVLGGLWVGWRRPLPLYPRLLAAPEAGS